MTPGPQLEKLRAYYLAKWGGPPGEKAHRVPFNGTNTGTRS